MPAIFCCEMELFCLAGGVVSFVSTDDFNFEIGTADLS